MYQFRNSLMDTALSIFTPNFQNYMQNIEDTNIDMSESNRISMQLLALMLRRKFGKTFYLRPEQELGEKEPMI